MKWNETPVVEGLDLGQRCYLEGGVMGHNKRNRKRANGGPNKILPWLLAFEIRQKGFSVQP
jgi:hypothetical protein